MHDPLNILAEPSQGVKTRRIESALDRTLIYKDWHRLNVHRECCVIDVDQLEYRMDEHGKITFVAVVELTVSTFEGQITQNLLRAIHKRLFITGTQGHALKALALALKIPCIALCFHHDSLDKDMWMYNLLKEHERGPDGWVPTTLKRVQAWLESK